MSNDDGDRGPWDDLRDNWDYGEEQPYHWDNKDENGVPEWENWEPHGLDGSHWHWELGQEQDSKGEKGDRFDSLEEANEIARDVVAHPNERIMEDTQSPVGNLGLVHVFYDADEDKWGIYIDAYIEY